MLKESFCLIIKVREIEHDLEKTCLLKYMYGCHGNVKSHGQSRVSNCCQIIFRKITKFSSVCFDIIKVINLQICRGQNPQSK